MKAFLWTPARMPKFSRTPTCARSASLWQTLPPEKSITALYQQNEMRTVKRVTHHARLPLEITICSRKWEEGHGVRAKHGLMSDDFPFVFAVVICVCKHSETRLSVGLQHRTSSLCAYTHTHTGGPPGLELVQCEITWVIKICAWRQAGPHSI